MTEPVVLLINPNSSDEVTRIIDDVAGRHRGNGTRYVTVKVASNPPAIETVDDEILAVQGLLASVLEWRDRFDVAAAVVACFGDPGVSELRHATGWQVHGIAYEAMRSAVERGQRFSIVCALPSAVPIMEQLAAHYGWADMLVSVRPLGISVLDIAAALEDTASRLEQVIDDCVSDGADAVCLGCASMTPLAEALRSSARVRIIDGVEAAITAVDHQAPSDNSPACG
ncbi:aspartate/glutamate racemase family protein [Gordonia sp. (in: high G+C Gram-positive bacteria)]|jgi:allantoin racemase|uniref:aspartate/glutamate racemase family protein n=1 Tax=Gordonia sp. (in: high G+C Gram-positive bacteria) TaxID=84139 RepID=UPI001E18D9AD|nr:aspartate/glutamate racemase family protein [Gordonia sp. (in: high G+C Gram-positive bacteria)]MCB1296758.1 hypothetical protein [Gordonia sp. (in: high G+C Gram-positive bacteria)]HMS74682.1 aspartate/glutamate racemase family protein [Gordonia sp. (in: high G+C Gram-positive bacteria)]HQV20881.1 aspartate/glutamate racemase family protein [Gordonia sp. (in: high G+C Gram-positive bacteria)]